MWGSRFFAARHWTARFFDATGLTIAPISIGGPIRADRMYFRLVRRD